MLMRNCNLFTGRSVHLLDLPRTMLMMVAAFGMMAVPLVTIAQEAPRTDSTATTLKERLAQHINLDVGNQKLYDVLKQLFEQAEIRNVAIPNNFKHVRVTEHFTQWQLQTAIVVLLGRSGYSCNVESEKPTIVRWDRNSLEEICRVDKDIPVNKLPPGRFRREWEIIRERHPNGRCAGWVLKPGWSPYGSLPPRYCFMRFCPKNHALTLDWATASVYVADGKENIDYDGDKDPTDIPPALQKRPKMNAAQAWLRVQQAFKILQDRVPSYESRSTGTVLPAPQSSVLRIRKDRDKPDHLRLVWQFAVAKSPVRVSVDVATGEVGGYQIAVSGDGGTGPSDPLAAFFPSSFPEGWIATTPPVR